MQGQQIWRAFKAALPICIGYIALGLPCGVLGAAAGMNLFQVFALSLIMYSGSGQYMIANLYLAGVQAISLSITVSLVSSRQLLYGSALSPYFKGVSKLKLFLFAATVTDESFGVNLALFQAGVWNPAKAQWVNTFSHLFWVLSNCAGVLIGTWLVINTGLASFAMTAIFLCLLLMQKFSKSTICALSVSVVGVVVCKLVGLGGLAILIGALLGVAAGMVARHIFKEENVPSQEQGGA